MMNKHIAEYFNNNYKEGFSISHVIREDKNLISFLESIAPSLSGADKIEVENFLESPENYLSMLEYAEEWHDIIEEECAF